MLGNIVVRNLKYGLRSGAPLLGIAGSFHYAYKHTPHTHKVDRDCCDSDIPLCDLLPGVLTFFKFGTVCTGISGK